MLHLIAEKIRNKFKNILSLCIYSQLVNYPPLSYSLQPAHHLAFKTIYNNQRQNNKWEIRQ